MMYFIKLCFGVLNATHNEVNDVADCAKTYIAKTTTSLSTVRIVTVLYCLAVSATSCGYLLPHVNKGLALFYPSPVDKQHPQAVC